MQDCLENINYSTVHSMWRQHLFSNKETSRIQLRDWDKRIPTVQFTLYNRANAATGMTASERLLDRVLQRHPATRKAGRPADCRERSGSRVTVDQVSAAAVSGSEDARLYADSRPAGVLEESCRSRQRTEVPWVGASLGRPLQRHRDTSIQGTPFCLRSIQFRSNCTALIHIK